MTPTRLIYLHAYSPKCCLGRNSECFFVEGGVPLRMSLEVSHLALVWLIYLLPADRDIKSSDTVIAS